MPDADAPPAEEKLHEFSDLPGINFLEFDPDNPPADIPEFLQDLLKEVHDRLNEPHIHISDVSFITGDHAGQNNHVHVSFDAHGLNIPEDREVRTTAVFDYATLPLEVKEAWVQVIRYLEDHLNSDPALFARLQADFDSTLDCDIDVYMGERQSL